MQTIAFSAGILARPLIPLVALIMVLFTSSCKKNEDPNPIPPPDPANPVNPWDFVGRDHNEGLDFIFIEHAADVAAVKNDPIALQTVYQELAVKFAALKGYPELEKFPLDYYMSQMTLGQPGGLMIEQNYLNYESYLAGVDLEPEVRAWLEKLYAMLAERPVTNRAATESLINDIRVYETELLGVTSPEKCVVALVAASVARHSIAYWGERSDYGGIQLFGWREAFFADALGAGVGAAAGAATGAAAGGAPSVPGALVGGAVGGIIASTVFGLGG